MTFHPQICTKKSSKWSKYSKLCVVGIQIGKYILKWICVYRINFLIRNSKIQANYTAKVKVVRESPMPKLSVWHKYNWNIVACGVKQPNSLTKVSSTMYNILSEHQYKCLSFISHKHLYIKKKYWHPW